MEKKSSPIRNLMKKFGNLFWNFFLSRVASVTSYILIIIGNFVLRILTILYNILKTPGRIFVSIVKPVHQKLGSYFPFNLRDKLAKQLVYAGFVRSPEEILGVTLMYAILLPIVVSLVLVTFGIESNIVLISAAIAFIFVWGALIMLVILLVERRTSSIEEVLPDVLSMIAQNMIAGMTPYNALWVAARPEFGPLASEIQTVARDTLAGMPLEDALIAMTSRVKSEKLERAVRLMIQGMRSGGDLPTVLQEIANDIRNEQNLFKRMRAETTAQAMFIIFAIVIGAPLLFAASLQFVTVFSGIYKKVEAGGLTQYAQTGMLTLQPIAIDRNFFYWYAISVLVLSSFFGALLVGLIRSGKLSTGITLIPLLIASSVIIFLALNYALSSFFGGMISI
ncbi:MAG: type II secretion system F family protein [Candidatus Altiarchaeota archaeon]